MADAEVAKKDVLAVVISHGLFPLTRQALRSLASKAGSRLSRIVLVDNGTPEPEATRFRDFAAKGGGDVGDAAFDEMVRDNRVLLVRNETNSDFGRACNEAVQKSNLTEKYILFFNNDAYCEDDFLAKMAETLDRREDAACCGAILLFPGTVHVQHAGVAFDADANPAHAFLHWDVDSYEPSLERDWPAVTGGCMLVRREDFQRAGGFCESLEPGLPIARAGYPFEDVDLCVRFLALGRKTVMCTSARAYHRDAATVNYMLSQLSPQDRAAFEGGPAVGPGIKFKQLGVRKLAWKQTLCGEDGKVKSEYQLDTLQSKIGKSYVDSTVLIVVPISGNYLWCLDMFLDSLLAIDYPRVNMGVVFITNNCGQDLIEKLFIWGVAARSRGLFGDVRVTMKPIDGAPGHDVIVKARNEGAAAAAASKADVLLFVDCDVIMPPLSVRKLVKEIAEGRADVASGVYCYKGGSGKPLLFRYRPGVDTASFISKMLTDQASGRQMNLETSDEEHGLGLVGGFELAWTALNEGPVVPVDGVPFGFTAMNAKAYSIPLFAGQKTSGTEDLSWCMVARQQGIRIVACTTERAAHLDRGRVFLPADPPPEEVERIAARSKT